MTIVYTLAGNLYINLTNRCTCDCVFCIRHKKDQVGSAENLWLEREPTAEEVIEELKHWDLDGYRQIVFCGYGEPTECLDVLLEIAKYLKTATKTPIRINTNGLSDLRYQKDTAAMLDGLIDSVSVSMNAGNAEHYWQLTRSCFGIDSFNAMLRFAERCKNHVKEVRLSVVDVLGSAELEDCRQISERIGVPLFVREYEE